MAQSAYYGVKHPTKGLIGTHEHNPYPNEKDPEEIDINDTLLRKTQGAAEQERDAFCPEGQVVLVLIKTC